jgi:hypothetical protein
LEKEKPFTNNQEANGISTSGAVAGIYPIPTCIFVLFLHQGRPYLVKRIMKNKNKRILDPQFRFRETVGKCTNSFLARKKHVFFYAGMKTAKIFPQVLNLS